MTVKVEGNSVQRYFRTKRCDINSTLQAWYVLSHLVHVKRCRPIWKNISCVHQRDPWVDIWYVSCPKLTAENCRYMFSCWMQCCQKCGETCSPGVSSVISINSYVVIIHEKCNHLTVHQCDCASVWLLIDCTKWHRKNAQTVHGDYQYFFFF